MLKIRRPLGRLILNMGIAIPGKTVFLIETAPRSWPGPTTRLCHLCSALLLLMINWLVVFISINATPKYVHWDGAVGVTTMLSLVVPLVVFVTACGATGRFRVVSLTAPLCSGVYTLRILIVLISINSIPIHVHWRWGCRCDDYVVACGAAGCTCDSLRCHR